MKEKNVVIFDLDGTIIENNRLLDKRIAEKINELEKEDNKVIFATSRSLRGIKSVLPCNLWKNTLILCNGAFVMDKGKVILSNYVDEKECVMLISYLCNRQVQFYGELGKALYVPGYVTHDLMNCILDEAQEEMVYSDYKEIQSRVYKLAIMENLREAEFRKMSKALRTLKLYCHSDGSFDIVGQGVSKWEAFSKLCIRSQYKKVIAFGNDRNDIDMLYNADIGVAVCTEDEKVLEVSDKRIYSFMPNAIIDTLNDIINSIET